MIDLRTSAENAQDLRIKHPDTFSAPNKEELDNLKVHDIVKICYEAERFWTRVLKVEGDKVIASVDNDLLNPSLSYKDIVIFNKNNIYAIYN
ncbi:hypothetical protein [Flammeovirga agarivorans]|uniref:Uncharacterized protein n=1 Tax=Flammeovirga agarivorans TaxID=2726742 RepID=A0A7X8SR65_9BACT|nr:hypothetical protein [Flammeovirga agarivorans]NLR94902.1 hypothetical protein [Flammeovirga agarivorans]